LPHFSRSTSHQHPQISAMVRLPHPEWPFLYPTTDISTITAIIVDHALSVARTASDAIVAAGPLAITTARFVEVNPIDLAAPSVDDESMLVSMDAPRSVQLTNGSSCVWGKKHLQVMQDACVDLLAFKRDSGGSGGKRLVIDRTGGGESLILQLTATMVGGIILVIVPLLVLTAN